MEQWMRYDTTEAREMMGNWCESSCLFIDIWKLFKSLTKTLIVFMHGNCSMIFVYIIKHFITSQRYITYVLHSFSIIQVFCLRLSQTTRFLLAIAPDCNRRDLNRVMWEVQSCRVRPTLGKREQSGPIAWKNDFFTRFHHTNENLSPVPFKSDQQHFWIILTFKL